MPSCMHHGIGCSPEDTPLHKCAGYFEHSLGCQNYVCENHAHHSRYGTYCSQCYPAPPVFARPRVGKAFHPMAMSQASHHAHSHR